MNKTAHHAALMMPYEDQKKPTTSMFFVFSYVVSSFVSVNTRPSLVLFALE
jgi:hypothetical protein